MTDQLARPVDAYIYISAKTLLPGGGGRISYVSVDSQTTELRPNNGQGQLLVSSPEALAQFEVGTYMQLRFTPVVLRKPPEPKPNRATRRQVNRKPPRKPTKKTMKKTVKRKSRR